MELFSQPPKELDFTVPARFLEEVKEPGKVNFAPSTNIFISECLYYGMNWGLVWCMACVITNNFRSSEGINNCFLLPDAKFRTWREGVRAGVQVLAIHMEHKDALSKKDEFIVWEGALALRKNIKGPKITDVKSLDAHYGKGFGTKVEALYNELIAFAAAGQQRTEPVVTPPTVPNPPLPKPAPTPEPRHEPKPESEVKPEPRGPKAPWKITTAKWLGAIGAVVFIAKFFLPGAVAQLVDAVLKIVQAIVEN